MNQRETADGRDDPALDPYAEAVARHQDFLFGLSLALFPDPARAVSVFVQALSRVYDQSPPDQDERDLLWNWCREIVAENEGPAQAAETPEATGGPENAPAPEAEPAPVLEIERPDIPEAWSESLAALPRDRRAAVLLWTAGFSSGETARVLGANQAWTRFVTHHGLRLFTRQLGFRGEADASPEAAETRASEILTHLAHCPPPPGVVEEALAFEAPGTAALAIVMNRVRGTVSALSPFSRAVLAHFTASGFFLLLAVVLGSTLFTTHPGELSTWALDQQRFAAALALFLGIMGLVTLKRRSAGILSIWFTCLLFLAGMSAQAAGLVRWTEKPGLGQSLAISAGALGAAVLALLAVLSTLPSARHRRRRTLPSSAPEVWR